MMVQQLNELTLQDIEMIMQRTNQKWRDCQHKNHDVYLCKPGNGFVFANRLTNPLSYKAILKSNNNKPIISKDNVERNNKLSEYLQSNEFNITDSFKSIIVCGPCYDLESYSEIEIGMNNIERATGEKITSVGKEWEHAIVKYNNTRNYKGIVIPADIQCTITNYLGRKTIVNDPNVTGHYKGDVLVVPVKEDGSLNFNAMSCVNNELFALTYNLNVGGWSNTGLIADAKNIKTPTLDDIKLNLSCSYTAIDVENNTNNNIDADVSCKFTFIERFKQDLLHENIVYMYYPTFGKSRAFKVINAKTGYDIGLKCNYDFGRYTQKQMTKYVFIKFDKDNSSIIVENNGKVKRVVVENYDDCVKAIPFRLKV